MVQGNSGSVTAALQQIQARTQQTPVCASTAQSSSEFFYFSIKLQRWFPFSSSAGYQRWSQHGCHAEIHAYGPFINLWAGRNAVKAWHCKHRCKISTRENQFKDGMKLKKNWISTIYNVKQATKLGYRYY